MAPNINYANELEMFETTCWPEINQLHAEYVTAIRFIRARHHDRKIICKRVSSFMRRAASPGRGAIWNCFCFKQAFLILSHAPVRASIRAGGLADYNGFCHAITRKFNGWRQGTPLERLFVVTNQALIEQVIAMYQAEAF